MKIRTATSLRVLENTALAVRIARAEGGAPYRVVWSGSIADNETWPGEMLRAFSGASGPVTHLVPNGDVSYDILPLPPLKSSQQAQVLRGVVAREHGGDPRDWLVDFEMLKGAVAGRQDAATAFARDAVVRRHLERATALTVRPDLLTAGYLALDALYRAHRPDQQDEGAWNLVCLDPQSPFLCVADPEGLLFQRGLPEDLSEGGELTEYLDRLTTEIERSNFFAQQAERSLRVSRVVVCGDPGLADPLVAQLGEALGVPADRWRPEDLFAGADGPVRSHLTLSLAGAAAALESGKPNLLPAEFRRDRGREVRRGMRKVGAVGAAVAVPLLLIGGLLTVRVQSQSLSALEEREEELYVRAQESAREYLRNRNMQTRQTNVDQFSPDRLDLAALLTDIAERTPGTVIYRDVGIERDLDGSYRLLVTGESLGHDGLRAQEVFVGFLTAMRACDDLLELNEQSRLELTAADEEQDASSRVIFSLEYRIKEGRS